MAVTIGRRFTDKRRRAYRLVVVGALSALAAVAGVVLWAFGAASVWLPAVAGFVTATCVLGFRRVLSQRSRY